MNVEPNEKAPAFHSEEILINAPVKLVYDLLSDISGWPEWRSDVKKVEIDGPPVEGRRFRWRAGGFNITSILHTVQRDKAIGWTGKIWWVSAVHNWYFESVGEATRVVIKESLEGFGSSMMKKALVDGMQRDILELKIKAENHI